jgi:pectate lyase
MTWLKQKSNITFRIGDCHCKTSFLLEYNKKYSMSATVSVQDKMVVLSNMFDKIKGIKFIPTKNENIEN